jgi:acyl-CoA reductase-like NAD-dependent aldehyde dehydrogenase/choline dehydrogenase-like flavoprotein
MSEPVGSQEATEALTPDAAEDAAGNGAAGEIVVVNPATGETLATVPELGADEVAALVAAARAAQPAWADAGFDRRAEVLLAARRWLVANGERVVETICAETGRPADETQFAELSYGLAALEFWAKMAPGYLADEEVETASPFVRGRRLLVRYAPIGVVGDIGPWNYPLVNSFGDCIPALAAGNAVVLKPSEVTPLTSLLMAEMLAAAGLPDDVFAVATGRGATGAALVDGVDMVMFTGSVATGKRVMARAAETLTPVSLELGGKDPMIVLADADLERAANAAVAYGMSNSGQVCISVERIYVEDPVHDEFVDRVRAKVDALRQGPPGPPGSVDVGAIIFGPQIELIDAHVRDAVDKGAGVVIGGRRGAGPGRFYEPTVLVGVDHSMRCMTEETFGPTLPVMKVADAEEAVRLANDGPYGLQASVWTGDVERGEALARRIEAGVCCVNDAQINYAALELPMGGWKASGLGSRHGADGIRKYCRRQSLLVTPAYAPPREVHYLPYVPETTAIVTETMRALAASELFDDLQRRTVLALCDTFVPSLAAPEGVDGAREVHGFWARAASHQGIPEAVEVAVAEAGPTDEQLAGLRALLDSLAAGGMTPEAPQADREALVNAVTDSGPEALAGITSLRALVLSLTYALPDAATGRNPNWDAIGYPGPQRPPADEPKPLTPRRPAAGEEELTIEADVCVVGSGAGGGVIAGTLAARGKQVCVVEAGGYFNEADFNQLEVWGYRNLYLGGGPVTTVEGQVSLQAGSALGGGTLINWQNCLRTFPWVREQWAREFGLAGLDGPDYDRCLDEVWERIGVTDACSELNGPHRRLREGCEALGWDFRLITRNVDAARHDPSLAGFGGFGDVSGAKQSTTKTYLADAHGRGADLVVNCRAERILLDSGRAAGVEGTYVGPDGTTARVVVRAPEVVVACGSLESPALLRRSGIGGPAVGDYLRLHPAGAVFATYAEPQDAWWGPPQAALSHEFADRDEGYGFLIEGAHHSVGISAAATPWLSGRQHKEDMSSFRNTAGLIWLIRDRGHGRVDVDRDGNALPSYRLTDERDVANFRAGQEAVARLHHAAGADRIGGLARSRPLWERGQDFDAFCAELRGLPLDPYEHAVFSAHQMGSCRMGTDPSTSVANPDGRLHDTPGVWIGDASAFPTASGTNPMVTIMALARRTAEAIAASS